MIKNAFLVYFLLIVAGRYKSLNKMKSDLALNGVSDPTSRIPTLDWKILFQKTLRKKIQRLKLTQRTTRINPNFKVINKKNPNLARPSFSAKYDSLGLKVMQKVTVLFEEMLWRSFHVEVDENFLATVVTDTLKLRLEK